MANRKRIALVAHDNRKKDLVEWVRKNKEAIVCHDLTCTGTTGRLIEEALYKDDSSLEGTLNITKTKSGPLGGDQQLGAKISEGQIDALIFLWDPMQAQPHDVDVKALLRIATLYNVPTAINRSTADFIVASGLLESDYQPLQNDYSTYIKREI